MNRHPSPSPGTFLDAAEWSVLRESLGLSPRELQVVRELLDDPTEQAIADRLAISRHTVHTHLERIFRKLGVNSRAGVIVRLFEEYATMVSRRQVFAFDQSWRFVRRAA